MPVQNSILAVLFYTPWFVAAGAALASIPIIIHILNRRRFRTVQWAAMEFLLKAMRKNRRRLKFEQWLLLAVRCLLIFLMGLALARPLGCDSSTVAALGGQRSALHVIVIDNSYSMGYQAPRAEAKTHLDQAKLIARRMIDRLNPGGEEVMVIAASSPIDSGKSTDPHAVTQRPTYDLNAARSAIERVEQTYAATDLNGALQLALRVAKEESNQPRKHLYILTDGTRSALESPGGKPIEGLRQTGQDISKQFGRPHLLVLGQSGQWNQAVLDLWPDASLVTTRWTPTFVASMRGFGSGPDPVVQWKVDGRPAGVARPIKLDLETPPQSSSDAKNLEGGPHVVSVAISAEDPVRADNTRWRIVDVVSEMRVLIVEGERGVGALQGSGSFLELALSPPKEADPATGQGSGRKTDSYVAPEPPIGELELQNKVLGNYRAVFLTNVGQVNAGQAELLKKYVAQGGSLIIFAGPAVNADSYNQTLVPRGLLPGRLIKTVSSNDKPFMFDFDPLGNLHPFLKEFRGQKNSGLNTAQVWTYWQLELPPNSSAERVLDYVGTRDPAITAHSLGSGRVVFISTTANPEWNGLTPKPAYVTLMHEILSGSVRSSDRWMNLAVGDSLVVPAAIALSAAPQLTDASKQPFAMEAIVNPDGSTTYRTVRPLARPGLYTLSTGSRAIPIAVNVPAFEADLRVVPHETIRKALGDIDVSFEPENFALAALQADSGGDWSWPLMAIVLLLAGFECFLAMRFGHYRRGAPQPALAAAAQQAYKVSATAPGRQGAHQDPLGMAFIISMAVGVSQYLYEKKGVNALITAIGVLIACYFILRHKQRKEQSAPAASPGETAADPHMAPPAGEPRSSK